MASVFSRIVAGEIPSASIYEDEQTFAFLDINPVSRGHTLVICKEEYPGLLSVPAALVAAVAQTTQRVAHAIVAALQPDGFNVLQNDGAAAGQVIFHYHVHIIPRWEGDSLKPLQLTGTSADMATLQQLAAQIRHHL